MALAYPGPSSDLSNIVARDAFLDALGDHSLRIRIRKDNSLGEAHHAEVCASLQNVDMLSEAQRSLGEDQGHVRTAGPVERQDLSLIHISEPTRPY